MRILPLLIASIIVASTFASCVPDNSLRTEKAQLAEEVRQEFLHSWNAYKKYAWGHDMLRPVSKTYVDWYKTTLLMTPLDALDTMTLMGFKDEADSVREYLIKNLSFDQDIYVKNFEITIRLLGGLLSNYQLSGDQRLLMMADDLGTRLMPVFKTPTGIPYVDVNLRTGAIRNPRTNPAEVGTLLIEFGTLSKLTGKPEYTPRRRTPHSRSTIAAPRSDSLARGLTRRPANGSTRIVTSAHASTRITSTC